jgi:hypothetical protein
MSNAAAASADANVNAIEIMMQSPQVSELNRLKMLRIQRLENDLQQNAEQEQEERRQSEAAQPGAFGDAFDGHTWGGPAMIRASQIREQIHFLQEGMRNSVSEKIFGPDGVELTKEEFQSRIMSHNFFFGKPDAWGPPDRDTSKYDLTGWTIPSLDGIVFSQCRVVQLGSMHHACNVSLQKCRIRTLGSVELPQGQVRGSVSFANNDITQLERVRFPSCERINLRDNFIRSLRGCTFLEGTAEINLENNFISNLEDLNFGALPMSLKRIILDGNPITDGLSYDEKETLTRKILYEISEAHNPLPLARLPPLAPNAAPPRAPNASAPPASGPPASAPPDVDFGNLFFGGGGVKRTIKRKRKSLRKFKRNNSKRNNKRSFRK